MRKVNFGKRYCLQNSFVVLLVFCFMAITFYALNGNLIERSNDDISGILKLLPQLNRTVYVPGKVWHAKHRFLQPKTQLLPGGLNLSFLTTETIKIQNKKLSYKWPKSNKGRENVNKDSVLMNEIRKIKNIDKNQDPKSVNNIENNRNHSEDLIFDKIKKDGDFNKFQNVDDAKLRLLSNEMDMPLFSSPDHKSHIQNLLVRGHPIFYINCKKLINGDSSEVYKAKKIQISQKDTSMSTRYYDIQTENCEIFKRRFGYITSPLTEKERDFPLAYSILMYKDVEQVESLLRAIYRPQNSYCIHIDAKTKPAIRNSMKNIAKCFSNVFITSRSVDVRWGTFSVLEPEIICMKELWPHKKWKYFINLTGQEFPLKTNYELVEILTAYNGANDLEGTIKRANSERWKAAKGPPHNIQPIKGAVHVIVQRGFVDYVLHSPAAKDFLKWVKKINVPDETFFSTLNHNPHLKVPGSYLGEPETSPLKPFLARFKLWIFENSPFHGRCRGKWVHSICIFGVRDLPQLVSRKEMFANKFHNNFQPIAQKCLSEWLFNNTRDYFFNLKTFNTSYYSQLDFVKHKVE